MKRILILACLLLASVCESSAAPRRRARRSTFRQPAVRAAAPQRPTAVPGEVLVKWREKATPLDKANIRASLNFRGWRHVAQDLELIYGVNVPDSLRRLNNNPKVEYAEENGIASGQATSNDPLWLNGTLWNMASTGYGVHAEATWAADLLGSTDIYVGVLDEGIFFTHTDLAANTWTNPFDLPDGQDNDGNGFADDVHGWDFVHGDNSIYDPADGDDHATHVSGTIGASGGNGIGVAGVAWQVKIISAKFLDSTSHGSYSNAIRGIDYLIDLKKRHGLRIVAINHSWGGSSASISLADAVTRAAKAGILHPCAAMNNASNNDAVNVYPANIQTQSGAGYDAVISVAAITSSGSLAGFSDYGATTVDLGAPGSSVTSTVPGNGYAAWGGTSMATPHVTGAVVVYAAAYPTATPQQIRASILAGAIPTPSLAGKCVTGGRLDVSNMTPPDVVPPPDPDPDPNPPAISVADASWLERDQGNAGRSFVIRLSAPTTRQVTVTAATADGTATVADRDYRPVTATVTFSPGEVTKAFSVNIRGDRKLETNEALYLRLTSPTNATIADSQGVGTILNDD